MNRLLKWVLTAVLLFTLLLTAAFVWAQPEDPTILLAILTWIAAGPGGVWVAGKVLSFLVEQIPGWQTISGTLRWWIVLLLSVGLTIGAYLLLQHVDLVAQLDPFYKMIFMLVTAWLGTQQQFTALKAAGVLKEPRA
jgi:hypothetical protein